MTDGDQAARGSWEEPAERGDAGGDNRGPNQLARPWKLVLATLVVIICLVSTTVVGSILVNVDWPESLGAWFKALLGGLLLLISTVGIMYAIPAVVAVMKDRGGRKNDHAEKYGVLGSLSLISPKYAAWSVALAAALFVAAILSPRLPLPSPPPAEPGVITVMSAIDESDRDPRYMLIQQWNTAHPENRVELVTVPGETDAQRNSMVNDAKSAHRADVYVLDMVWMAEFIEHGYIRPIDESRLVEYEGDQFIPNVWDTCRDPVGGRDGRWALPLNSDAGLLYYRSDVEFPVPTSFGDYFGESAGNTFAAAARRPEAGPDLAAANVAQFANEEILTVVLLEAIWAAGGEVVNESGVPVLNEDHSEVVFDDSAQAALDDLAAVLSPDRRIVLPGSAEVDELEATRVFREGKVLFMRNWSVAYDNLMAGGDDISFGVTALPHKTVLGGQNIAISSATDKPRAAQELIEFLASPSSQLTLFEVGGFAPTRPSAYINSRRPFAQELRSAVEQARIRPTLVHYTEFSKAFREGVWNALNRLDDPGELDEDLARRLANFVKKG